MNVLCAQSLSCVRLFVVPHTVHVPLFVEFSRQEYIPGYHPDPGIEPMSPESPALAGRFFTVSTTWEVLAVGLCSLKSEH